MTLSGPEEPTAQIELVLREDGCRIRRALHHWHDSVGGGLVGNSHRGAAKGRLRQSLTKRLEVCSDCSA